MFLFCVLSPGCGLMPGSLERQTVVDSRLFYVHFFLLVKEISLIIDFYIYSFAVLRSNPGSCYRSTLSLCVCVCACENVWQVPKLTSGVFLIDFFHIQRGKADWTHIPFQFALPSSLPSKHRDYERVISHTHAIHPLHPSTGIMGGLSHTCSVYMSAAILTFVRQALHPWSHPGNSGFSLCF